MRRTVLVGLLAPALPDVAAADIPWRNLPKLPKALGGQFAGIAGHDLLVAGASFLDPPPWSGGVKQRLDTVYGVGSGADHWRLIGDLPYAIASGAVVSTPKGCCDRQTIE